MSEQYFYLGLSLSSPILLSSGEASNGFEKIEKAIEVGAGAAFTPSIRLSPMIQPEKDIYVIPDKKSVLNAQGHSSINCDVWINEILPEAKQKGYTVIAKTGYTLKDVTQLVPRLTEAGAAAIEIIAPTSELMEEMVKRATLLTNLPVSAKMSGRWGDIESVAEKCIAAGAKAVTLMDTPGPALKIDIRTGKSVLTGETKHGWGYGWLSGDAILPFTLAYVAKLRRKYPEIDINGVGGITCGESALQMILCGATVVSVQSAVLIEGPEAITRIKNELIELANKNWGSIESARSAAVKNLIP